MALRPTASVLALCSVLVAMGFASACAGNEDKKVVESAAGAGGVGGAEGPGVGGSSSPGAGNSGAGAPAGGATAGATAGGAGGAGAGGASGASGAVAGAPPEGGAASCEPVGSVDQFNLGNVSQTLCKGGIASSGFSYGTASEELDCCITSQSDPAFLGIATSTLFAAEASGQLYAPIPLTAPAGTYKLDVNCGPAATGSITLNVADREVPHITSILPSPATATSNITITGTGLAGATVHLQVDATTYSECVIDAQQSNDTTIVCMMPGTVVGAISVVVVLPQCGNSDPVALTVVAG